MLWEPQRLCGADHGVYKAARAECWRSSRVLFRSEYLCINLAPAAMACIRRTTAVYRRPRFQPAPLRCPSAKTNGYATLLQGKLHKMALSQGVGTVFTTGEKALE